MAFRDKRYKHPETFWSDDDMRSELEALSEKHDKSKSAIVRVLIKMGLAAYYERGGKLDD